MDDKTIDNHPPPQRKNRICKPSPFLGLIFVRNSMVLKMAIKPNYVRILVKDESIYSPKGRSMAMLERQLIYELEKLVLVQTANN